MFFQALLVCFVAFAAAIPTSKTLTNDIDIPVQDTTPVDDIKTYWQKKFKPTVTQGLTPDGYQKSLEFGENPFFSGIKINIKPYPGGYVSIKTDAGEIIKPILAVPTTDDSSEYDDTTIPRQTPVIWNDAPSTRIPLGWDSTVGRVPLTRQDFYTPEDVYARYPRAVFPAKKDKKSKDTKESKDSEDDTTTTTTTTTDEEKPLTLSELNKYYWVTPKTEQEIEADRQWAEQVDAYRGLYGGWPWYGARTTGVPTPYRTPFPTRTAYDTTGAINPWSRIWGAYGGRTGTTTGTGIRQPVY